MRARYSAYATGDANFLIDTTHPESPHAQADRRAWKQELVAYCRATQFVGLTVHAHERDDAAGRASVTFTAALRQDGRDVGFTEHSTFVREGMRWYYLGGESSDAELP